MQGALARLLERGLITTIRDGTYVAAPPAVALGALITERRDALRTAELALARFAEEHRAAIADRSIGELIEVVTGVDAIRHRFLQVQHAARDQVRTFVTAPFVAVPPGDNPAENAVVERGVPLPSHRRTSGAGQEPGRRRRDRRLPAQWRRGAGGRHRCR